MYKGRWRFSINNDTSPWYDNQILDSGLNEIVNNLNSSIFWHEDMSGIGNLLFNRIFIGKATNEPAKTDIQLYYPIECEPISVALSSEPEVVGNTVVLTLAAKFDSKKDYYFTELGYGGDALFSRVVVPQTNVKANDTLIVYYELTIEASYGSGLLSYRDDAGINQQSVVTWCIPVQSLMNGITSSFYNPSKLYGKEENHISTSEVSNFPTELEGTTSVTLLSTGFEVTVVTPMPTFDLGAMQIGSISDMLCTLISFDPKIPHSDVVSFTFKFQYLLGE